MIGLLEWYIDVVMFYNLKKIIFRISFWSLFSRHDCPRILLQLLLDNTRNIIAINSFSKVSILIIYTRFPACDSSSVSANDGFSVETIQPISFLFTLWKKHLFICEMNSVRCWICCFLSILNLLRFLSVNLLILGVEI